MMVSIFVKKEQKYQNLSLLPQESVTKTNYHIFRNKKQPFGVLNETTNHLRVTGPYLSPETTITPIVQRRTLTVREDLHDSYLGLLGWVT